jgi:N,N'-diacetyllegionaminate synthase
MLKAALKPYVIAEAGTNHNGSLESAIGLVDMAAESKADSIKFQIIYPEGLYLTEIYQDGKYTANPVVEQRKKSMLKDGDYLKLASRAVDQGIDFTASVFDEKGLDLLLQCKPKYIKIASCDLNNIRFLRKVAQKAGESRVSIILSTGLSTLGEIERSVAEVLKTGFKELVLLHCVSVYPAKLSRMNLGFIRELKKTFGLPVGLSDHTQSNIAAAVALAEGAIYFEKHVTLDKKQEGFDHAHSIEGPELRQYVADLNDAFEALKPVTEKLSEDEMNVRKRARRALYAARDLKAGERISEEDVLIVRPEAAMAAHEADMIIGKVCKEDIGHFEPFTPGKLR